MNAIKLIAVLCLVAGPVCAEQVRGTRSEEVRGPDTLAMYFRGLVKDLVLPDLSYLAASSTSAFTACIRAEITGQVICPATRFVNNTEMAEALAEDLNFVDYVLGLDAILVLVNRTADPELTCMSFSTLRRIFTCEYSTWSQVPGSTQTGPIFALAHEERSGNTATFVARVGGFVTTPPDSWWNNYPCVNVCTGDGCIQMIGATTAAFENAIGFTSILGLMSGNRDLAISDDNVDPPTPCVSYSVDALRDLSYPFARQLHMYRMDGPKLPDSPEQWRLLYDGAMNCGCNCPLLAANGFFPVTDDYCSTCTRTCPPGP